MEVVFIVKTRKLQYLGHIILGNKYQLLQLVMQRKIRGNYNITSGNFENNNFHVDSHPSQCRSHLKNNSIKIVKMLTSMLNTSNTVNYNKRKRDLKPIYLYCLKLR